MLDTKSLNELSKKIHQDNVERGFYDEQREVGTNLMLVVSELGEAIEADRKGYRHFIEKRYPKMVECEEWRSVSVCEDYEVSNLGRVRSKDMQIWNDSAHYTKKGRILKAGLGGNGYFTVSLKGKTYKVAVLVAMAFLTKKNPTDIVNHIDGNKQNDNVGNLEWVSYSKNNLHALQTGLRSAHKPKLSYDDCIYIAHQHKNGRAYTSILKDRDWGVTKSAIQRICKNYKKYTDSVEFEIADAIIRLFDLCGLYGIDIEKHIETKLAYNRTRGYKHGKAY